jgi:hypothetical protein
MLVKSLRAVFRKNCAALVCFVLSVVGYSIDLKAKFVLLHMALR